MSETPYDLAQLKRPIPALATYFFLTALLTVPAFPFVWLYHMCKYWTLEYNFDDEGISMRWGVLWRREILLTYRRIQDIHLTRNVVQRWMGLADVKVQTAGGSAAPEMNIIGAPNPEALRDALYARMRGVSDPVAPKPLANKDASGEGEVVELLQEIRDLLAAKNEQNS
jgi:putative membrane protein